MTQPPPDGSAWPTAATEDRPDAAYPDAAPQPVPAAGPPEWPPPGSWPAETPPPAHAAYDRSGYDRADYDSAGYDRSPYEQGATAYQQQAWEQDAWERAQQPGPWAPPEEPAHGYDRYTALHETARRASDTFLTWEGADDQTTQLPPIGDAETVEGEVVWHQRPAAEPFRAKHEKPGEWQTDPPDHLAFEHSPPAEVQPGVQDDQPAEAIPLSMLPQPWQVPFDPQHNEPHPDPEPARPARRNTGRWVALAVVLTVLLLGGGAASAYLLLRDADSGKGSPDPATAVDRFMTEVYTRHDAVAAEDLVCREARDQAKIAGRVAEIEGYANEYPAPAYAWGQPAISAITGTKATVDVQLTMTTDDERAARQQLTFTVIRKTGWLVCDVTSRA